MPPFPKPSFGYSYDVAAEITALRKQKLTRAIPEKGAGTLLVGTWNIANLGVQERTDDDIRLLAEIISWFDVVGINEVNDNYGHLADIHHELGGSWRFMMSDAAGNNERLAFLYDSAKVKLLEEVGEVALAASENKKVKIKGIRQAFQGFDRTPYFATFQAGNFTFLLATVHLFFGTDSDQKDIDRRCLETLAVAQWAAHEKTCRFSFTRNVIALGDFNMPKADESDAVYRTLTSKGMELPQHTSLIGSSIMSDAHYDQVAFFPGETKSHFTGHMGVFDFDNALFADLWKASKADPKHKNDYKSYCRYHVSDHRPMWIEFAT